jgi:hypothetical protein
MHGLDWLRTCGLLALYGIQVGKINIMHQYLGIYHSIVAMDGLHDEKNWPKGEGIVDTEIRRRLVIAPLTLTLFNISHLIVLVCVFTRSVLIHSMGKHDSLPRISM